MLSAPDAALARRESAMPGIALLLDADAVAETLAVLLPELAIRAVRARYVRYKPATNCLVSYTLVTDHGAMECHAKAFARSHDPKLGKGWSRRDANGAVADMIAGVHPVHPSVIPLEEAHAVLRFFPSDRRLKSLGALGEGARLHSLMGRLAPEQSELLNATPKTLGYKPERRYVAALQCTRSDVSLGVLKLHARAGYVGATRAALALTPSDDVHLSLPIGASAPDQALLLPWAHGELLSDRLLAGRATAADLSAVGAALAALHAQRADALIRRASSATRLSPAVGGLESLMPELGGRARSVAARALERIAGDGCCVTLHGDLHARQVLVEAGRVTFLDLDEACRGDAADDLASFVAQLEWDAIRGCVQRPMVMPLSLALLDGYRDAGGNLPRDWRAHAAAALLELTHHPFRHREAGWDEYAEQLVERADELLAVRAPVFTRLLRPSVVTPRSGTAGHDQDSARASDPSDAASDPALPTLGLALEMPLAEDALRATLTAIGAGRVVRLNGARVVRHKVGRRCLIEYDVDLATGDRPPAPIVLIAKLRARGADRATARLHTKLRRAGLDGSAGIEVPEPLGVIPGLGLWLQRKVPGVPSSELLTGSDGVGIAERVAEAANALHRVAEVPERSHGIADELRILRERLGALAERQPVLRWRLERVLVACERVAAALPGFTARGIHRDLHPEQLLVDGSRIHLLDLDLFTAGDPALDVGNYIAHVTEMSLRLLGDASALRDREEALETRFLAISGPVTRRAIRSYAHLALVRHIELSSRYPDRRALTEPLLALCEQRLGCESGNLPTESGT